MTIFLLCDTVIAILNDFWKFGLQLLAEFKAEENKSMGRLVRGSRATPMSQFSPEARRELVGKKV